MCYPQFRKLKSICLDSSLIGLLFIHSTLFDFECWECENVGLEQSTHTVTLISPHHTPCSVHWLNTLSASKLRSRHTLSLARFGRVCSLQRTLLTILSNLKVGVKKQKLLWPDYFRTLVILNWFLILEIHFYIHPRNVSTLWEEMEIVLKRKGLMLGNWVWWELYASLFWCSELKLVWMFMLTFIWLISPGFKPTLVYN